MCNNKANWFCDVTAATLKRHLATNQGANIPAQLTRYNNHKNTEMAPIVFPPFSFHMVNKKIKSKRVFGVGSTWHEL